MKRTPFDHTGFEYSGGWRGGRDTETVSSGADVPHRLEQAVQRQLLSHPNLQFSSLVIRRIPNGVCLEGVVEADTDLDVSTLVRTVAGVEHVLNHLVVRRAARRN